MRNLSRYWTACLLVAAIGCSSSDGVPVEGTVTFEGKPVEQGAISFLADKPGARSEGAVITNGSFSGKVTPGTKRVEIRASRPKPPDKNDPNSAGLREDFIPARYNSATTLSAEISSDKENKLTFELSAK